MQDKEMVCRAWPRITPQTQIFSLQPKHICLPHSAQTFKISLICAFIGTMGINPRLSAHTPNFKIGLEVR